MPATGTAAAASCPWEADLKGLLQRIEGYLDGDGNGYDSQGNEYSELKALWVEMGLLPGPGGSAAGSESEKKQTAAAEEGGTQKEQPQQPAWYSQAFDYWEAERNCPANVDGVLGGFGHVSPKDIAGSVAFVERLRAALPNLKLGRVVGTCWCACGHWGDWSARHRAALLWAGLHALIAPLKPAVPQTAAPASGA